MKRLSFVLAALLITGVAFADKKCCKKGTEGKACCKKEASASTSAAGATVVTTVASPNAPAKACCKKSTAGKACCKKEGASAQVQTREQASPETRTNK